MTLEKLMQMFPPDEGGERWSGYTHRFEWKLQRDSMAGWQLFITFRVGASSFHMQGLMKGETLQDAAYNSVLWMRRFRVSLSQLYEDLAPLDPPSVLERILEED